MKRKQTRMQGKARAIPPLDQARLESLALSYVARFATTKAKLISYLQRKIHERGDFENMDRLNIDIIVNKLVGLGYIDDFSFAQSRSTSLLNRGYGKRRIQQALKGAGIDEITRNELMPNEMEVRKSAVKLAKRRRFGPFHGGELIDEIKNRPSREKQIAAMVRAGHDFNTARTIIEAASKEELEAWLDRVEE